MSKEAALQFLNTLGANEKAKELLLQREKPTSEEEKIKAYAEIAAVLGESITAEDFREAFRDVQEKVQKQAEDTAAYIRALEDDDVENVAGGYYYQTTEKGSLKIIRVYDECSKDFTDTNCWWDDACDYFVVAYFQCGNHYTYDYG